tara:strand:- start:2515 stop:2631 length:117 start_codon:yes stop_codon:yes gene_type:complete
MKETTKKMWMNIFSTALGVALGFGIYKAIDNQMMKKDS